MKISNSGWIVSPAYDLAFLANIGWPLLLLPGLSTDVDTPVDFWQVYFLTLPHRWLTLLLVLIDRDRRQNSGRLLIGLTSLAALAVVCAYFGSGAFICLGLVDFLWNGWHFGSQHAGVLRIYSRKCAEGHPLIEKWGIRLFVMYVILRTSSSLVLPNLEFTQAGSVLAMTDYGAVCVPIGLLVVSAASISQTTAPKLLYLTSISLLYCIYLGSVHFHKPQWLLCMATAASMFHAVEYFGIVSHYAARRKNVGSRDLMMRCATHWSLNLTVFVFALGTLGLWINELGEGYQTAWQGLNLWAAFSHYAFDGVIWKLRQPETAAALVS